MSLEKTVDKHDNRLDALGTQMSDVVKNIALMTKDIKALNIKADKLETKVDNLESSVNLLTDKLKADEVAANQRQKYFNFATNAGVWRIGGIVGTLIAILAAGGWGIEKAYYKSNPEDQKRIQFYQTENAHLKEQLKQLKS